MILFVCSQGFIRSRTAEVLCLLGGLDARSCGTDGNIQAPVNNPLLMAAEAIYCMQEEHVTSIASMMGTEGKRIESLGIPDEYYRYQPELIDRLIGVMHYRDERVEQAMKRGRIALLNQSPSLYVEEDQPRYAENRLAFGWP